MQYAKRDAILEIEREVQRKWAADKVFELDALQVSSSFLGCEMMSQVMGVFMNN